ncbi:hypothetical protein Aperf_G00000059168 [Anoplocephala perfoliata]
MLQFLVHILSFIHLLTSSNASRAQAVVTDSNTSNLQVQQPEETRQTHEVQFNYRIAANRKGHLTCEVLLSSEAKETMAKFSNQSLSHVFLRCPQVATEICYVDCTPACVYDEVDGCVVPSCLSSVIESCRFDYNKESDKIILDYTIKIEALDRTGDWNCEYQGVSAPRSLKLQASPKLPSTKTTSATTSVTTTSPTTATTASPTTPAPVTAMIAANFPRTTNQAGPKSALAHLRPEVILALIVLSVVAIAVNIALSIRCAMTKCYFDYLRQGNHDPFLGRCLCLERSGSITSPSAKWHHHEHQPYGMMMPPPSLPPPPPAFYGPYHQSDQQSESSGLLPSYARHTSINDTTIKLLVGQQQQQPQGTLSTTSSTDTGTSNPFPASPSAGILPVYYPGKQDSIEIGSMTSDLCNQTKVYLIKVADPNPTDQQQLSQKSRMGTSLSSNVYEEEVLNAGGRGPFHTITPTLVQLPGSTEPAGLIICHRLADDGSDLSKTQSEADFAAGRRGQSPSQTQSYVLLSTSQFQTSSQPGNIDVNSQ